MSLLRIPTAALQGFQRRSLVSTVLLTKQWNDHSVSDLRKEARSRGLPVNGGKATLITRIQEHETRSTLAAIAPEPTPLSIPGAARQMSSVIVHSTPAPTPKTVAPTSAASAPGVPPADMPKYNKQYLDIKFPNISGPDPEPLIQIPYSPDRWHSYTAASAEPTVIPAPKIVVVAGNATHPGVSASVQDIVENTETHAPSKQEGTSSTSSSEGGIFSDIMEDLGLAGLLKPGAAADKAEQVVEGLAEKTEAFGGKRSGASYTLDAQERTGAWTLGGILVGAFLLGGFFDAGSAVEKTSIKAKEVKAKAEAAATDAASKVEATASDLKGKAQSTVSDVKTKAGEVKDAVGKKAEEAKDAVGKKAEEVKSKVTGR